MSYKALYRTYRPADFNEVAGQTHITTTLKNALVNGKVAHAYLFSGPRGTGKTSIAKIFAKAINCEKAPTANPCNVCANCLGIQNGSINDVIEIDAASNNGVDEIREIRDKVRYLPGYVKFKVYIIDEVHMLSTGAFNALLKTLEEPPAHVIFILCTTEPQKIPLTIHSRCQRFDFKAITPAEITEKLREIIEKEHIQIEEAALDQIALYAEGGLRDAIGLLDQTYSYSPNFISIDDVNQICGALSLKAQMDIVSAIMKLNASEAIHLMDQLLVSGKEVQKICQNLIQFYRDILVYKNVGLNDATPKLYQNEDFIQLAKTMSNKRLFFYMDILNKAANDIKWSNTPRLYLELAFIKMTDEEPGSDAKIWSTFNDLENRIGKMEKMPVVEKATIVAPQPKQEPLVVPAEKPVLKPVEMKPDTVLTPVSILPEATKIKSEEVAIEDTLFDTIKTQDLEVSADSLEEVQTPGVAPAISIRNIANTYPIEFVEDVLNNGNRDDKTYLINHWYQLSRTNTSGQNEQYASLFETGQLVASSADKIIVTFASPGTCNRLMKPSVKAVMKSVMRNAFDREIEYMAIPTDVFQTISDEFAFLWRQGKRKIKLSPIVHSDLRDVSDEIGESSQKSESKVVTDALDIFGDLVKIKKQ